MNSVFINRFSSMTVVVVLAIFLCACSSDSKSVPLPSAVENKLGFNADKFLSAVPNNAQIAIRVWDKQGTKHIDLARHSDNWQSAQLSDSLFGLGPMSQLFTADLAVQLFKAGVLRPDQKISDLKIPVNPGASCLKDIKLIHLLNHSSSLPNLPGNMAKDVILNKSNPYDSYDAARLTEFLTEKAECNFTPGNNYMYSLVAYAWIAQIMELFSQKDYSSLIHSNVFERLNLSHTGIINSDSPLLYSIDKSGNIIDHWTYASMSPASGIYSSPNDMMDYIRHLQSTQSPAQLSPAMMKPDSSGVGLGWHFHQMDGNRIYSMTGATGDFTSTIRWDHENNRGILIMTNVSALTPAIASIEGLADKFIAK